MSSQPTPSPGELARNPVHLLAFGFGTGLSPVAPGTVGSLVGVLFYILLASMPALYYWTITAALLLAGVWICGRSSALLGVPDHGGIVWDEIVGYLITMGPIGLVAARLQTEWLTIMAGFVLFRIFDIVKPWPIGWVDRRIHGGAGIMLDDVIAGVYAMICLQVLVAVAG